MALPRRTRDLPDLSEIDPDHPETEGVDPTTGHRRVRRFTLRAIAGPDAGAYHVSSGGAVVVGTHRSADFHLGDPTLSRFHFEIELNEGEALLKDLESRNGTRLGGVPILLAPLRHGSTITAGRTQLRFELGSETVAVPLSSSDRFGLAAGASPAMRAVFAVLERAADAEATVLLQGETGTGKDLLAESLHRESPRRRGPFVAVDCGALPRNLLEGELFGHERGAFTGAEVARQGAFEAASGGTLFLDEIGELDLDLQPKLLRALESREVRRVGATAATAVDVRILAATSRNLRRDVNRGQFRADLFYRLAVIEVAVPPLRERSEDIPVLAAALLEQLEAAEEAKSELLGERFVSDLKRHRWPGNVRELKNYLEQCLAIGAAAPPPGEVGEVALPPVGADLPYRAARERWLRHFERLYLEDLLRRNGGNVSASARAAGVDRMHLYRLLRRCGLR